MRCLACGGENPDRVAYCGFCGKPLRAPRDEERKWVSTAFCDVVGYTPRTSVLSTEELHGFLTTFYDLAEHEFKRFGGTPLWEEGNDAVKANFGAPDAQEDAPERAVRAALAIIDAISRRNAAEPDLGLHVRLAVTSGDALVTFDREPDRGSTWSEIHAQAQRLEKQAPHDGVVVDRATYEATAEAIEYEPLAPMIAKGIDEPLPAWRALRPRARRGLELRNLPSHPLVNRDSEMTALVGALEQVIETRRPQRAVLVGEPGIGKTRLVQELFRHIEIQPRLITWRLGRSAPFPKGMSFWALVEIIRREAGVLDTDDAATVERRLRDAVDAVVGEQEAAKLRPHLHALAGVDAGGAAVLREERGARFAAWRSFLDALARRRPIVLVFEDLHWADPGLLDFLEHLAEPRESPLLMLCTVRDEPGQPRELVGRVRGWDGTRLELRRLTGTEGRHLVAGLVGDTAVSPQAVDGIVSRGGGNPLFTMELVRELAGRDQGAAGRGERVPRTVREIIAARLDALAADHKRLLNAAAVIGRAVAASPVAAVTGVAPDAVAAGLDALDRQQFLARETRRADDDGEPLYRFEHPLVREAAYETIPDLRKAQLHERTAAWIEGLSADRADRAEMLAHHYRSALALTRVTGEERTALEARARVALVAAGDRAFALQAFGSADEYFAQARELWPSGDPELPRLLLRLGRAQYRSRRGGKTELTDASRGLAAAGDLGLAAEAEATLARLAYQRGLHHDVTAHIERAVALVEDAGPTRSRLEVLVDLANLHSLARDHERTLAVASEAIRLAQELDVPELEASALSSRGISRGLAGDPGGRRDLERSVAITEQLGSHLSAHCVGMLADLECQTGYLRRCFRLQGRARRHAAHFGDAGFIAWLEAEGVAEAYWTGAWAQALAAADARIADRHFMSSYCRVVRGRIALAQGDAEGALEDARAARRAADAVSDPQIVYPARAFAARAEVAVGDRHAGAADVRALLAEWAERRDYPASAWAVDVAYALEAVGAGEALLAAAAGAPAETRWLTAARAFAEGDFEAAAAGFARVGSRPDEAIARLHAASVLDATDRSEAARDQRARAVRFFRRVGAIGYLDAAGSRFVARAAPP